MEAKRKNLIQFGEYTPEAADEEQKQVGGPSTFVKLEQGKNRLRVLPPVPGQSSPFKIVKQHSVEIPTEQYPIRFECLGVGCPACLEEQRLSRTGNPRDRKRSDSLRPKPRVFAHAIQRGREEEGVLVWEFGKSIHQQLTKILKDQDAGGNFTHPYDGFDVIVDREGTGMDTEYTVLPARQATPLHEDEELAAEWCETRPDLDKFARLMSIDEVRDLLEGNAPQRDRKQIAGRRDERGGKAAPPQQPKRRSAQDDLDEEDEA